MIRSDVWIAGQSTGQATELAKVANLEVDAKSYWLYTNDPFDNRKRREAFETYGFEKGLRLLAEERALHEANSG